eukprot:CAMPEP_0113404472 /NCGR_PEP_ID=MMETSP0013_2-20120614/18407_1 /TAXON_ID=2843 ORGANISM="Skeletonema costatum, Strain 1716" /NCGR_SAMPLE_ID=MMETSP0013_2 /ASSEMBLY_ACC=CAM_ASM_000158 /LENGTH=499 /DNA_ID=CAMNT_0000290075 /DNA_START=44 /DNA_END=1543 /DNA_ORIENTATION=+ /assembly_acc=CAM_ASM_000158
MMIKSTTLFLAIGSIVAAASNSADVPPSISNEDWDYQVVGEARSADEDRGLLRSNTECITIRMKGDSNADKNSVLLEDLTDGTTIEDMGAGTLPEGIWDSPCLEAPDGNLLKLTIETPEGYSSTAFHAVFVGTFRFIRVAGGEKNDVDVRCFRLTANHPFVEDANCDDAPSQQSSSSGGGGSSGGPPVQQASTLPFTSRMGCGSGEKKIQVIFEKDSYNENKWWIQKKNTNNKVLECDGNGNYCESEVVDACLEADDYEVVMRDAIGDGCPKFELRMEKSGGGWSHPLIAKCYNGKEWKRHFHTKPSTMTPREVEWMDAHNERRQTYYYDGNRIKDDGNDNYIPQVWDSRLAEMAQGYANRLLDDCESNEMSHDSTRQGAGENMAKNRGTVGSAYGGQYPANSIVNRFVEAELDKPFGERYHLTQVLWQASGYVGCADGFKEYVVGGVTKHCHTQVCRYSAPGNCGVNANNDFEKMMYSFDELNCGGEMKYPPEGMHAM